MITGLEAKKGGTRKLDSDSEQFHITIILLDLIDLEMNNRLFTWSTHEGIHHIHRRFNPWILSHRHSPWRQPSSTHHACWPIIKIHSATVASPLSQLSQTHIHRTNNTGQTYTEQTYCKQHTGTNIHSTQHMDGALHNTPHCLRERESSPFAHIPPTIQ